MATVFRAEDEPVISRMDYWRHVAEDSFVPLDVHVPGGLDFKAQIRTEGFGPVRVSALTTPPGEARRTTRHIRRSDPELYKIDVQAHGNTVVGQEGREVRLAPGDVTLVDLSRPASWINSRGEVVGLMFPRQMLPLRSNELARLTATRIHGQEGTSALIARLVTDMSDRLDDLSPEEGEQVGTAVIDLLTMTLAAQLDRESDVPWETRQRALLVQIKAFIEERLSDPDLSPETIAAAHDISVRDLHKLFEAQGQGVAERIRRRRLERCRDDLLNSALDTYPVGAVGTRWGFDDAAGFDRAYRRAYGAVPKEFRMARRELASPETPSSAP